MHPSSRWWRTVVSFFLSVCHYYVQYISFGLRCCGGGDDLQPACSVLGSQRGSCWDQSEPRESSEAMHWAQAAHYFYTCQVEPHGSRDSRQVTGESADMMPSNVGQQRPAFDPTPPSSVSPCLLWTSKVFLIILSNLLFPPSVSYFLSLSFLLVQLPWTFLRGYVRFPALLTFWKALEIFSERIFFWYWMLHPQCVLVQYWFLLQFGKQSCYLHTYLSQWVHR